METKKLTMQGIKAASAETNGLPAGSLWVEIIYSMSEDRVRAYAHADSNSYTKIDADEQDDVVIVRTRRQMSANAIRGQIEERLLQDAERKKENEDWIERKSAFLAAPWLYG